jgi:D-beta-D-heptose 7-phosphate kinase/D-beta-D-heptose 1-phosphate adenosyltransferase
MYLLSNDGTSTSYPSSTEDVADVTGAGDTALSTIVALVGVGLDIDEAIKIANIASGLVVKKFGCAQVTLDELVDATFK